MDGFEQFLASLLIAVAPERKPSRDLLRVCHPSLRMAGPEMRPGADSFRYYRWSFCVCAPPQLQPLRGLNESTARSDPAGGLSTDSRNLRSRVDLPGG
jgi:hypothetical protein